MSYRSTRRQSFHLQNDDDFTRTFAHTSLTHGHKKMTHNLTTVGLCMKQKFAYALMMLKAICAIRFPSSKTVCFPPVFTCQLG